MKATFRVNPELLTDVLHLCDKYVKEKDLRTGDKLVTLMAAARAIIRMGNLPPDDKHVVEAACIERLRSDEKDATFREAPLIHQ